MKEYEKEIKELKEKEMKMISDIRENDIQIKNLTKDIQSYQNENKQLKVSIQTLQENI